MSSSGKPKERGHSSANNDGVCLKDVFLIHLQVNCFIICDYSGS